MYIYIITQYGNTVYKKFKFAQKNKPDKAFGDFRCQTSGECVLVIEGKSRDELKQEAVAKWEEMTLEAHMAYYEDQGIDRKEAMKLVAKDRGVSKREVYKELLEI